MWASMSNIREEEYNKHKRFIKREFKKFKNEFPFLTGIDKMKPNLKPLKEHYYNEDDYYREQEPKVWRKMEREREKREKKEKEEEERKAKGEVVDEPSKSTTSAQASSLPLDKGKGLADKIICISSDEEEASCYTSASTTKRRRL